VNAVDLHQDFIDKFYQNHGPCCAGCDWWRWHNVLIGDCTKSAPVSVDERAGMLDMENLSLGLDAGHVITPRDHVCGDFVDSDPDK